MDRRTTTLYFLAKLVATPVGQTTMQVAATSGMSITRDCESMSCEDPTGNGSKCCVRIGGKTGTMHHGVAGHFMMQFLNFSDEENKRCKTLDEAERLAREKHEDWLANAYDWYVAPVEVWSERDTAA